MQKWLEHKTRAVDLTDIRGKAGRNCAELLALAVTRGHRFPRGLLEELAARGVRLPSAAAQPWLSEDNSTELPGESARMLRWVLGVACRESLANIMPE
jgi:hypothetical protein